MKGFYSLLADFEVYLKGMGYSESTGKSFRCALRAFYNYLNTENPVDLREVKERDVLRYLESLQVKILRHGKPYSKETILLKRSQIRLFFRYLYDQELILQNPAEDIRLSIRGKKGRRGVFTVEEIG